MQAYLTFILGTIILLLLIVYVGTAIQSTKRRIGTLLVVLAAASSLISVKYLGIPLGIDLRGGSEFIVEIQPGKSDDGTLKPVTKDSVEQAIDILEKRLNPDGQKDLTLQPMGENRIAIQMPGVTPEEIKSVRNLIEQVAHLEFRMVHSSTGYEQKLSELKSPRP